MNVVGRLLRPGGFWPGDDSSAVDFLDFTNTHHLHRNNLVVVETKAALGRQPGIVGFVLSLAAEITRLGKSLNNFPGDGHHGHMVTGTGNDLSRKHAVGSGVLTGSFSDLLCYSSVAYSVSIRARLTPRRSEKSAGQ